MLYVSGMPEPSTEIDRINDKTQKELTAHRVGLTREKVYKKIIEALEAEKIGDIEQANGNITRGKVPDMARRQWGVEQAIRIFQDDKSIGVNISTGDITTNTMNIDVSKLSSTQLVDVLMGRFKPVIDAQANTVDDE